MGVWGGWNKGLTKETDERVRKHAESLRKPKVESKLCECGCNELAKPGNRFVIGHANKGRKFPNLHSEKWKENHRRMMTGKPGPNKGRFGEKNYNWKGNCHNGALHYKSWIKNGQDFCEIDGTSNEENFIKYGRRLSMHCVDGNYTNLKRRNWITTCDNCHKTYLDAN